LKRDLRDALLKKRNNISPDEKGIKEAAIRKRLMALTDFKKAKSILFYASFRTEVDTIKTIKRTLNLGKKVILPLVDKLKHELRLFSIKDITELAPGHIGIPEPTVTDNREVGLKNINVVIVPGAGFDVKGNRLGYGAGYYDKLLSKSKKHITTIALAFEEQITEKIHAESHDIKVDKIVTDKMVIHCSGD